MSYLLFRLKKSINNVCFLYGRVALYRQPLIPQKHSNKMFSSGFRCGRYTLSNPSHEMYLTAGKN